MSIEEDNVVEDSLLVVEGDDDLLAVVEGGCFLFVVLGTG